MLSRELKKKIKMLFEFNADRRKASNILGLNACKWMVLYRAHMKRHTAFIPLKRKYDLHWHFTLSK